MTDAITFQPILILIDGHDTQGQLVLYEGQLVAVLARLDGEAHDPEHRNKWHLEAGFGPCDFMAVPPFDNLDHAGAWCLERCASTLNKHM